MNTAASAGAPELLDVTLCDWEGARKAHLKRVPSTSTVGQVVSEAVSHLGLPLQHLYQALVRGREVDAGDTLGELGIGTDAEIELVPEVSAG